MIYAVEILDQKFVKIGFSSAASSCERIATLQTGCPFEIKEIFVIEGTLRQEQSIHALLRSSFGRIRVPMPPNEWYPGKNHFFQQFLHDLRHGFDAGLTYLARYDPSVKQPGKKSNDVSPNIKWPTLNAG